MTIYYSDKWTDSSTSLSNALSFSSGSAVGGRTDWQSLSVTTTPVSCVIRLVTLRDRSLKCTTLPRDTKPGHSISYNIACALSEVSDQPVHLRMLFRLRCPPHPTTPHPAPPPPNTHWILGYPQSALRRLIRLRRCAGWSVFARHTCILVGCVVLRLAHAF